ncbi:diguanylate cyclase (GGDEF)-like protein [Kineococcus radiotolerans]|uniref:Diguanylate cyclase (GGDEF)-like protein n=1 Tax=Kineococcus radiotolerans TaxID=131568 RepID=A0A7W4TII6_KINRA|nr:bifunctional diguanylate cyclase/phosphodiesterase [Kineococcus radiotolerans]MBB2899218.1 diguanylate cyclase (GGDEF)-like protein [Kineococcus radiotolerans]
MRHSRWWIYALFGVIATVAAVTLPSPWAAAATYLVVACATPVAILAATGRRAGHPAPARRAWRLIAVGEACSAAGDVLYNWLDLVQHRQPFPSVADVFYLAAYPLLAVGLFRLGGRQRVGRGARLEMAIFAVAMALPMWVFMAEPVLVNSTASVLAKACDFAYPVADLVLLVLLVRLASRRGLRNPASRLLLLGAAAMPVADVVFSLSGGQGWVHDISRVCWLVAFWCWGAAALHPRSVSITTASGDTTGGERTRSRDRQVEPGGVTARGSSPVSRRRSFLLMLAVAVCPLMLGLEAAGLQALNLWDIAVASLLIVGLGVTRMHVATLEAVEQTRRSERLRAQVEFHTTHDVLTGLPQRAHLLHALRRQRSGAPAGTGAQAQVGIHDPAGAGALIVLGVDRLKVVNDLHGDEAGDDVLRAVAARLNGVARRSGSAGRLGGDEFALLLPPAPSDAELHSLLGELVEFPVHLPTVGRWVTITCSLGLTVDPGRRASVEELLREATAAAAQVRARGGAGYAVCDAGLRAELAEHADLETALSQALRTGELELYYQPVVDLTTERLRGFEALLRWQRPGVGFVPPDVFIPVAERGPLICDIGRWVLNEAVRQLVDWRTRGVVGPDARVGVNLSGRHLTQPSVVADVRSALQAHGLPAGALIVEATETVAMDRGAVVANLEALREVGVLLSLDDFGTGHTSIQQLQGLPFTTLKIDKSFLGSSAQVARSQRGSAPASGDALIGLMVHAAHAFGMTVVAEGVEETDQVRRLRELGCDFGQGYLFARPAPAAQVERTCAERWGSLPAVPTTS